MSQHLHLPVDRAPQPWTGRVDGQGEEHLRWHQAIRPWPAIRLRPQDEGAQREGAQREGAQSEAAWGESAQGESGRVASSGESSSTEHGGEAGPGGVVLLGFSSDEGVERNQGRRGAAGGPAALRAALGSLSLLRPVIDAGFRVYDAGDVVTEDPDLEGAQHRLGQAVSAALDAGQLPIILGGGHEIAYGTYQGVVSSRVRIEHGEQGRPARLGILNLDAHFDLRQEQRPTSGTPFRQILEQEAREGTWVSYRVVGISETSNTQALFDAAESFGVRWLPDTACGITEKQRVSAFIADLLAEVDLLYLTVDLDVLPAAVTPGVSAPAACGVPLEVIEEACRQAAASGKLAVADIAELNPEYDVDGRTAKTAARLIHRIATTHITSRAAARSTPGEQPA